MVFLLSLGGMPVQAQARSVYWERWDIRIHNVDAVENRFDVVETHRINFTGTYRFGFREISHTNLTDISNVRVTQDGVLLRRACDEAPGTFCPARQGPVTDLRYYFTEPMTDRSVTVEVAYQVTGALRIYEGGDQLWWMAIPDDHAGARILESTIRVELPPGFGPRPGIDPIESYGVPATIDVQGTVVEARATRALGGNERFEIRLQYPHNPAAVPPRWQSSFDEQRSYDENVAPLLNLGLIALGLLMGVGGPLLILAIWYTRGRDPEIGPVPEYLSEPPSDLPAPVVGTLIDEHAHTRDILGTIIDLARRGYLVIEEEQKPGAFGIGMNRTFTFKRTDMPATGGQVRAYEKSVLNRIFPGNQKERTLDSLRNKFYSVIPQVQNDLYSELVKEALFKTRPDQTRRGWSAVGTLMLALAGLLFFFVMGVIEENGLFALFCVPVGLGITGFMISFAGSHMPAKTRKGAEEAAKWRAFRTYLSNIERYGGVEAAASRFDAYLPYAIVFGIERSWMRRFSQLSDVPAPTWYYPTYSGRRYRWGSGRPGMGLPGSSGPAGRDGGNISLDDMSGQLATGLDSLSSGLTSMLDSASRIITSQPQSSGSSGSWSSGGGSWSGGGSSGGGSSGGGRSGFG